MTNFIPFVSVPLIAVLPALSRADEPASCLNGTWEFVAAIESDGITSDGEIPAERID